MVLSRGMGRHVERLVKQAEGADPRPSLWEESVTEFAQRLIDAMKIYKGQADHWGANYERFKGELESYRTMQAGWDALSQEARRQANPKMTAFFQQLPRRIEDTIGNLTRAEIEHTDAGFAFASLEKFIEQFVEYMKQLQAKK